MIDLILYANAYVCFREATLSLRAQEISDLSPGTKKYIAKKIMANGNWKELVRKRANHKRIEAWLSIFLGILMTVLWLWFLVKIK